MSQSTSPTPGLWFLNGRVDVIRASASAPDGTSVTEHTMVFGESPPLHVHRNEDEVFHILEGRLRFKVGDAEMVAGAGETAIGPRGVPHTFRVESPTARFLVINTGGDFEALVREVSRPAETSGLPAPAETTADMVESLSAAFARHGIDLVGAPLAA